MSIKIKTKDEEIVKKMLDFVKNNLDKIDSFSYESLLASQDSTKVLLELSDHERKTFQAVVQLGKVTAEDVASITKRARA